MTRRINELVTVFARDQRQNAYHISARRTLNTLVCVGVLRVSTCSTAACKLSHSVVCSSAGAGRVFLRQQYTARTCW